MSSLKRKEAPQSGAASKATKRSKSDKPSPKSEKSTPLKSGPKPTTTTTTPTTTKLKDEAPLFPRGGGSVLSALEHKQIQIQAKQDVLFEQQSGQSNKKTKAAGASKKKGKASSKDSKPSQFQQDEDHVKIESLNYKRLVKGSLVLGQVAEINSLDLVLALPNNILGHVPITAISDALNERISAEAAEDDEDDKDDEDNEDDVDLRSLFSIGQYLRAYVTSTSEDTPAASGKPKKQIELSLRPEHTNSGLAAQDAVLNAVVMASVVSAEDHGFIMDLSLSDSSLRGFLPRKEAPQEGSGIGLQPGSVILCMVTSKNANGNVVQLTTKAERIGKIQNIASDAKTINAFLPGSAVELLVTQISRRGLAGKIMGSLDATADVIHSGLGPQSVDLEEKYKVGKKIKARVICNFPNANEPKLGVSLLEHIVSLKPKEAEVSGSERTPLDILPLSSIVEKCTITKIEQEIGVFVDIGVEGVPGFVHISRLKEGKVDMLSESSGPFKPATVHRGRVVGYSALDGVFQLSFEKNVLDQPYLRIDDVPVAEVVSGEIEKLIIGQDGVSGLIVKLAEGVSGLVPETHMADVKLQHPEKKFREGMKVKARVLSTDASKRQIRLTLKKTLVNSEAPALKSFDDVVIGGQTVGTIISVLANGAVVQFYGTMRGFLPVSEMSEAYIHNPKEHFRVGQVVNVHVLNFDAEARKLYVSCKDPAAFGLEKQLALKKLNVGETVTAKVVQKTEDDIFVELTESSIKAILSVHQLTDGSSKKNQSAWKKIYVGQTLSELVVLDKNEGRRSVTLTRKPSLFKAAQEGTLPTSLADVKVDRLVQGFVRNVTATAVFVQFAGQLTALLPKSKLPHDIQNEPEFGLEKYQSLLVKVSSVDHEHSRVVVSWPTLDREVKSTKDAKSSPGIAATNPIDSTIDSMDDVCVGKLTKAQIVSIKDTQLNVKLADNIQGRIDVSQVFDSWDEIANPKSPLEKFKTRDTIEVRVLGIHDAKNHRFLPVSHRSTHSVFELSTKPSDLQEKQPETLTYDALKVGSTHIAFVNNVQQRSLWVNLSPNVRGRINTLEISDDVSQLDDLAAHYRIGSAIRVRVLAVDSAQGRLDLSARTEIAGTAIVWDTIKQNMVLPGRVTKVNERQIMVQLSESVSGPIHLVDISDDYDDAKTAGYSKNSIIRVSVVHVDKSNKKIRLSSRPSRVLNSAAPVKDKELTGVSQLHVGDIIRGFVKNVADKGLFISLGGDVTAMVRISDLSDRFLKDWKEHFQVDQLVKGRVTSVDSTTGQVQMTLKASVVDGDYTPLSTINDMREGQIVTGKIRKVEEFGAFIVVDGSANVSGLCHRSEMAEKVVEDARKLFNEGDVVKAIILKLDKEKKRINFGLKPSYFEDDDSEDDEDDEDAGVKLLLNHEDEDDEDEEDEEDEEDAEEEDDEDEDMEDASSAILITGTDNEFLQDQGDEDDEDEEMADEVDGLETGGFDWSADALDKDEAETVDSGDAATTEKKKKRKKAQVEVDKSGDLAAFGPRTAVDYEQLLNRQPNSSSLWIEYMALQMQVSELAKAREVAERAVSTINSSEETEKINAWTAYLNLEVRYGTGETVDEVFKRACQLNDPQEVHQRMASIYIQEGKANKTDGIFQTLVKKFGATSPEVWYNYAHWLHAVQNQPEKSRALISRATQALPSHAHLPLMTKFASLEYTSPHKNPELGRTMFEGLLASFPKRFDLWNQLLDHEDGPGADPAVLRDIFERATKVKGLKARAAKKWFKRWADWEEKNGNAKSREKVSAKASEWVRLKAEAKKEGEKEGEDEDEE